MSRVVPRGFDIKRMGTDWVLCNPDGDEIMRSEHLRELHTYCKSNWDRLKREYKHKHLPKITRVVFRIFPKGCGVIAVFPDEKWDAKGNLASYMHIGQHGACSPDIASITRPATEAQYAPLLQELQRVGYENIKVCKRITN